MGTLIVNYYRKTDPKDDYVPNVSNILDQGPFASLMSHGNSCRWKSESLLCLKWRTPPLL